MRKQQTSSNEILMSAFMFVRFNSSVSDLVLISGVDEHRVGEVKTPVAVIPLQFVAQYTLFCKK